MSQNVSQKHGILLLRSLWAKGIDLTAEKNLYLRINVFIEIFTVRWLLVILSVVFVEHLVCLVRCIAMSHLDVTAETLRTIIIVLLIFWVFTSLCLTIKLFVNKVLIQILVTALIQKHTYFAKRTEALKYL